MPLIRATLSQVPLPVSGPFMGTTVTFMKGAPRTAWRGCHLSQVTAKSVA